MPARDFLTIIRPLNCLMAAVGVFIGYSISLGQFAASRQLAIAMAVAFLICAAGITLNDYYDRHIDKKRHPGRPIASGAIKAEHARFLALVLFIIAIYLAFYYLNPAAFAIAVAFTLLYIIYPKWLVRYKYIGNWVVASGTAFTLVFGASLVGIYCTVALLAAAALFANLARELIKDLEDKEMDKGSKISLAMLLPEKNVKMLAGLSYLAAIAIVYVPYGLGYFGNLWFVAIVSIANLLFIYSFKELLGNRYSKAQHSSKYGMLVALVAFLLGVLR